MTTICPTSHQLAKNKLFLTYCCHSPVLASVLQIKERRFITIILHKLNKVFIWFISFLKLLLTRSKKIRLPFFRNCINQAQALCQQLQHFKKNGSHGAALTNV